MQDAIRFRTPGLVQAIVCLLLVCVSLSLTSCEEQRSASPSGKPSIEFTSVPAIGSSDTTGDAGKISTIKGRVIGAQPGQQIVLYAHAINDDGKLTWFVQPFVRQSFTKIGPDSKWRNLTHPGTEYAALLVDPGFQPPPTTLSLPTDGVLAVATTQGRPPRWRSWWFTPLCIIAIALVVLGLYLLRIHQVTRRLRLRFEERLSERTRVAQQLHDTLLQGIISASMQLHVVADQLPLDSSAKPHLIRILDLMARVIEEGRNTVTGLRSSQRNSLELEQVLSQIQQEFPSREDLDFHLIVEGSARPLHPVIRDEIYSIGREALINAFRHSQAKSIEVELEYASYGLRVLVRDNGVGFDPKLLQFGRDGHWGLSGMRERANRIGARLRVLSRLATGTEVELSVPSNIAFVTQSSSGIPRWVAKLFPKWKKATESFPSERKP